MSAQRGVNNQGSAIVCKSTHGSACLFADGCLDGIPSGFCSLHRRKDRDSRMARSVVSQPTRFSLLQLADVLLSPLTLSGAWWLRKIRSYPAKDMPCGRSILKRIGVLPIRDHYYEPLINTDKLSGSLRSDRDLPGLDLNSELQLSVLRQFCFEQEILSLPMDKPEKGRQFYFNNGTYGAGDAEYLYSMIRLFKPARIIEIGSGSSTLAARAAISRNIEEDSSYICEQICIEPYECPWLEEVGVQCVRNRVEDLDPTMFSTLGRNDILFIDSSHVIRPQGDVLYLYQRILPRLRPGVFVHVHDIFTPKDYLDDWIIKEQVLWNEQYLLEAFLTLNSEFEVIGALNYLSHHYPGEIQAKCPILAKESKQAEPGAFWMRRRVKN